MNFIDLFSGAGGLSEGFINKNFNPIAHVEIDVHACKTIQTRLVYHQLKRKSNLNPYYQYLRGEINRDTFIKKYDKKNICENVLNMPIGLDNKKNFSKIDQLAKNKSIDVIIGGPPCQAYSLIGRARDSNNMENDPRNFLYKEYGKFLEHYKSQVFVFENVIGLVTAGGGIYFKNMQIYFKNIGYNLDYTIQRTEEFGVLQKRKRIILIGWKKELPFKYPNFSKNKQYFKIKDILEDLKHLKPWRRKKYYPLC